MTFLFCALVNTAVKFGIAIFKVKQHNAGKIILLLLIMIKPVMLVFASIWAIFADENAYAESASTTARQFSYFDLPGQSLQAGIIEFALQANITVIADSKVLAGQQTSPVIGSYSTEQALTQLLSSTSVAYSYQPDSSAYLLTPKPPLIVPPEPALQLNEPLIAPVEEVLVTSQRYPFRYHTVTNTMLHGGMSYYDSSRFLNVLPSELIDDQQAIDLADFVKYASGITPGDGESDTNDDMFIRGFQRHAIYVDGFRLSESTGVKQLPANIERVEILKGPSTLLYGQAEPGGIVNVVRKKPQKDSFIRAGLGVGSEGRREATVDINSQLPVSAEVDYRVVVADEAQDEVANLLDVRKQLIATSINWHLNADTVIAAGYEYQYSEQTWDRDTPVLLPFENTFEGASLEYLARQARPGVTADYNLMTLGFTHSISPEWRLRGKYAWHDEHRRGVRTSGDTLLNTDIFFRPEELGSDFLVLILGGQVAVPLILQPASPETIYSVGRLRSLYDEEAFETENHASLNLEGSFDAAGLSHHLTLGADWQRQDLGKIYTVEARTPFPFQSWPESQFLTIWPQLVESAFNPLRPLGNLELQRLRLLYDDYGIYLLDSVELNKRWLVSAGTRYTLTTGEHFDFNGGSTVELQTYKKFSSQLGLVFKPTETQSIYVNFSEALRANYHIEDVGPRAADPELSNQIEIGLKSILLDGRLLSSIGIFTIDKNNIVDLIIIEGEITALAAHQQRVRGIDLDFTWQALPQLDVIGAFSWIDPQIVSGENQGNQPALAAEQTFSLFARYEFYSGLELTGGYKYVGKRFADDPNAFWLGDYGTVDLGLAYDLDLLSTPATLQLAIKNALDVQYFTATLGGVRENESSGRTLMASLKVAF
jgi:TonB-dependent siderophore receptor